MGLKELLLAQRGVQEADSLEPSIKEEIEEETRKFPFYALLLLYDRAYSKDLYINYMEGFKLLVDFLSPIEVPPMEECKNTMVPKLYHNYDAHEIERVVGCNSKQLFKAYEETVKILYGKIWIDNFGVSAYNLHNTNSTTEEAIL
jgi:hypothetical protein